VARQPRKVSSIYWAALRSCLCRLGQRDWVTAGWLVPTWHLTNVVASCFSKPSPSCIPHVAEWNLSTVSLQAHFSDCPSPSRFPFACNCASVNMVNQWHVPCSLMNWSKLFWERDRRGGGGFSHYTMAHTQTARCYGGHSGTVLFLTNTRPRRNSNVSNLTLTVNQPLSTLCFCCFDVQTCCFTLKTGSCKWTSRPPCAN